MFIGIYNVRLRQKNRIAFPSKLRKVTGDSLFITNWFENSLLVLPKKDWEELVSNIFENASVLLPEIRDLDRFIYGGTFEVELDSEGRFVMPKYLKEYAQIKDNVIITGGMWYIQMWDEKRFENYRAISSMQIKDKAVKVFEQIQKTKPNE